MAKDKKEGHSGVEQAGCAYQRKIRWCVNRRVETNNVQSNINTLIIQKLIVWIQESIKLCIKTQNVNVGQKKKRCGSDRSLSDVMLRDRSFNLFMFGLMLA